MEFSPKNAVVQLCLQGMDLEGKNMPEEAGNLFLRAWNEATNDFEKFMAAYFVGRLHSSVADKLHWVEITLQLAQKINNNYVKEIFPALYSRAAECYEEMGDSDMAKKNQEFARLFGEKPVENGPFYHGTRAGLQPGDLLNPGGNSNYKAELKMNHIYFTALLNAAGLAAELAKGDGSARVYLVEPTGSFESDPNVTDKKFPGNPTRSFRSQHPLRIVGEIKDWVQLSSEELQKWLEKLANNKGEIIN